MSGILCIMDGILDVIGGILCIMDGILSLS